MAVDPSLLPVCIKPPTSGGQNWPDTAGFVAAMTGVGSTYTDPVSGVTIVRLTTASSPVSGAAWLSGPDYGPGSNKIGRPTNNVYPIVILTTPAGAHQYHIVNFDLTNRTCTFRMSLSSTTDEICHALSYVTPNILYVAAAFFLRKFDISGSSPVEITTGGWPKNITANAHGQTHMAWFQGTADDRYFAVMAGLAGPWVIVWDSQTDTVYERQFAAGFNEFRMDKESPVIYAINTKIYWHAVTGVVNTIPQAIGSGQGQIYFSHADTLRRYGFGADTNGLVSQFRVDFQGSNSPVVEFDNTWYIDNIYEAGQWVDQPATTAQWGAIAHQGVDANDHLGTGTLSNTWKLALGAIGVFKIDGSSGMRYLCSTYNKGNVNGNPAYYSNSMFPNFSPDGKFLIFKSNINNINGFSSMFAVILPGATTPTPVTGTLAATQANQTTAIRGWTTTLFNFATTQASNTAAFVFKKSFNIALAGSQSDNTGAFTALFGMPQPKGTMAATSLVSGLWGGKVHGSFVRVGNNFDWVATQDDNAATVAVTIGIKGDMAGHEIVSGMWGGKLHSEFGYKGVTYSFAITATQGNATAALTLEEAEYFVLATTQANNTVAITADATTLFQFDITQADNTAAWEYVPNASIFFSIEPTESGAIADFGMHSDATPELGHHGGDDEKGEHDEHDYMKKLKQQFKRKQEKSVLAVITKFLETVE